MFYFSGLGQHNGHGESSVSIGKVFKLCQENTAADNSSSPPRDWFSRKRSQPRGCPAGQTCRAGVLGRRAAEYGAEGEDAFPGSGNPAANKDCETLKLKKGNEELRKEVAILKKFRAFLRRAQA